MNFLFCSGSCKQSTRNFPHTCETSTASNTVISRLASAVRTVRKQHGCCAAAAALLLLPLLPPPPLLLLLLVGCCCCYLFALLLLLLAACFCSESSNPLPFVHLRHLKSSHLMWWQNFYSVPLIDTQEADVNQSNPHSFGTSVPLVFALFGSAFLVTNPCLGISVPLGLAPGGDWGMTFWKQLCHGDLALKQ